MSERPSKNRWSIATPEGRWAGFGPYYAMFPVSFAYDLVRQFSKPGDTVVDPFCGRGTTNYVAQVLGRDSFGCDVNPVAWVYSKTKTDPCRQVGRLESRVQELADMIQPDDYEPENTFQEWAWCPGVLAFLNSARRNLKWRTSKTDWTLAAIILVYLHAKRGGGLSNQMRQSKSMAPDYSVAWWKARSSEPPVLDPLEFILGRIRWRYAKGLVRSDAYSAIRLGDASRVISQAPEFEASLLLTSPPYCGITNYRYDNWIRLWALGGPARPHGSTAEKYVDKEKYADMVARVFQSCKSRMRDDAVIVVRTDRRRFTLETTAYAMSDTWPDHRLYGKAFLVKNSTQTQLFGDISEKPGEVDLLALPRRRRPPLGYIDLEKNKPLAA